ncbi:hypothetical protein A2V68_01055 [candidate division Kazan bacterium RBG_13_50_9]|uniref:Uncharacterized protein n=1 Tax=candidate division Kazan bacterium RBG_13_50_9 TaxID=1798535 RepID=A0A1F4NSI1_UNCK3|nr:MAG: hypothetical protein A2V68_01055 [candidate division Kazan bacterium RBG_13_50_9]
MFLLVGVVAAAYDIWSWVHALDVRRGVYKEQGVEGWLYLFMTVGAAAVQCLIVAVGWGILLGAGAVAWFDARFWLLATVAALICGNAVAMYQVYYILADVTPWSLPQLVLATGLSAIVGGVLSYITIGLGVLVCLFALCMYVGLSWDDYRSQRQQLSNPQVPTG